jgi:hypothetical protein
MADDPFLAALEAKQAAWAVAGYVVSTVVVVGCVAQAVRESGYLRGRLSLWDRHGGAAAAWLLVLAAGAALFVGWKTNKIADQITAHQNLQAARLQQQTAVTEERLLNERRLTANERWRLERVERAVLPRSHFVNWPKLAEMLKSGQFPPVNVAYVSRPEAGEFAMDLAAALQSAGMLRGLIPLPSNAEGSGWSSTGVLIVAADSDGQRLAELLWRQFEIGGGSASAAFAAKMIAGMPADSNTIFVGENNSTLAPGRGQPGEGLDRYGGPDPAPH